MASAALAQFLSVAAIWTVAVVIPGPNFFTAARIASARDRRAGFAAVAGLGAGTVLWGCAGAFGVRAMFEMAPRLYVALTLIGAAYLLFIGGRIVAASFGPPPPPMTNPGIGPALSQGFLTSISNPKSALFVASLFATVMPRDASFASNLSAVAEMTAISVGWYGVVVSLLTTRHASMAFGRMRRWVDRFAGAVFMAFGLRIIVERV